jgi:hypothetical protein
MRASTPAFAHSKFTPPARAATSFGGRGERLDGRHVEPDREGASARGLDLRGHRLGARAPDVGHCDRHPLGAEGERDAAPYPASRRLSRRPPGH